jgi:hypothetical protein
MNRVVGDKVRRRSDTEEIDYIRCGELSRKWWSHNLAGQYSDFKAENPDAALSTVLEDFRQWLRHTLG